jgi:polyphosphate kinase
MAAKAGVDVKIICRTGCSIAPVKNLEVRSKAGQYLEHDRIYIFGNKAYISSADLLFRNISKRLEILCEIPLKKADRIFDGIWNSQGIHKLTNNGKWELM